MSSDRDGGRIPGPAERREEPQDAGRPAPPDGTDGTGPQAGPSGSPQVSGTPDEMDLRASQGVDGGPDLPKHDQAAQEQAVHDQARYDPTGYDQTAQEQAAHDQAAAYAHAYGRQAPDHRPYAQAYEEAPRGPHDPGRSYEDAYAWRSDEEQSGGDAYPPRHEPVRDAETSTGPSPSPEWAPDAEAPPSAPPRAAPSPFAPGQGYFSQPDPSAGHDYWPPQGHPAEPQDFAAPPGPQDEPQDFTAPPGPQDEPQDFTAPPGPQDESDAAVAGMPPGPETPGPWAPGPGAPGPDAPGPRGPGFNVPGQARPPRRHRKIRLMTTLAAGVALLVVIAVVVLNMADNSGGKGTSRRSVPPDSAAGRAQRAAQYLSGLPALRFSGSFASGGGTAQTDIWVTKAGSAVGTITLDGDKADLVIVDGETYVKASEAFWRSHGGEPANAQDYADRWSRAPAKAFDLDIARTLAPSAIVQRLRSAATSTDAATLSSAPTEYVNSVPAIKVGTPKGAFYLSPATPFKLLRVAGTGTQNYQLDVTEPTAAQVTALFTRLRLGVGRLVGSRDPSVKFVGVRLAFSNCNNNVSGCTLQLTATKVSTSTPTGGVRAVMLGRIVANGRTLGTCRGGAPLGAGRTVQLSCTVSSAGWRNWMREARSTPGTHRYNAEARVVAEALSAAEVSTLIKGIDQEQQAT